MITFNNIYVQIDKTLCLSDVSGHFPKNMITAILGPNGAGKTTLLRTLSGLQDVKSGITHINDIETHAIPLKDLAKKRSFLPANPNICKHLRVQEILSLNKEDPQSIMERLNVGALSDRLFITLSMGEKTRILLALLYLEDTPIWFLDEPLAHLDPAYQHQILTFLEEMKAHKTIIMTLHDLNIAKNYADQIYLLRNGMPVAAGPTTATLTNQNVEACFRLRHPEQTALGLKIPQNKNTKKNAIDSKGGQGKFTQPPHQ